MMKTTTSWISAPIILLWCASAFAQVPPDIAERNRASAGRVDPQAAAKIYAPLHTGVSYDGITVERNLQYGDDSKQVLDLFAPGLLPAKPAPVLMFVHGGAFTAGDKGTPATILYDNVMLWAVKNGLVGVNIDYRLAPQFQYPSAQLDIAQALAWVEANAKKYGGDANAIFLMGHSAGAAHVATYLSHPQFFKNGNSGVRGAILVSGLYEVSAMGRGSPGAGHPYFGDDVSKYAEQSSIKGLVAGNTPLFMSVAELDPAFMITDADHLKTALCEARRCPIFVSAKDHNHLSEVYAVNTSDNSLTGPIVSFIKSVMFAGKRPSAP